MITVIAGVNGAGKSSLVGAYLRASNGEYFNPDEAARNLLRRYPEFSQETANAEAWRIGYEQLELAVQHNHDYTIETTLGGNSICKLLHRAIDQGRDVRIFYCGLESLELHVERVAQRVRRGGHFIPEAKIKERWVSSIHNMLSLIPRLSELAVFDNSFQCDSMTRPMPKCLFVVKAHQFTVLPVSDMPEWAKPLAARAMQCVIDAGYR